MLSVKSQRSIHVTYLQPLLKLAGHYRAKPAIRIQQTCVNESTTTMPYRVYFVTTIGVCILLNYDDSLWYRSTSANKFVNFICDGE